MHTSPVRYYEPELTRCYFWICKVRD